LSVERVAINVDNASIPDNGGNLPHDVVITKDGSAVPILQTFR